METNKGELPSLQGWRHRAQKLTHSYLLVLLAACMMLSGCTVRLVDFTVISTKNVAVPSTAKGKRVSGEDCVVVFLVPLGIPSMETAIDRAIEGAGEEYDALVDGVLWQLNHAFLIGQLCYKVDGTPINTKASVSRNDLDKKEMWFHSRLARLPQREM